VRALDTDRRSTTLSDFLETNGLRVLHRNLQTEAWRLEGEDVSSLLHRLNNTGRNLKQFVGATPLRGVISGLNQALYVDTSTRDQLVTRHPGCASVLRKLIRGRDIGRWSCHWNDQWHILIPSSQNTTWPWSNSASEEEAEAVFSKEFPSIYEHLRPHVDALKKRGDKGRFWWELRACDYYEEFDRPKIVVQCIAFHSQFAIDYAGYVINNKAVLIPSDDLYLLAVLNSRVMWWIISRTFQHLKDEGLSIDVQFLVNLPVPEPHDDLRTEIRRSVTALTDGLKDRSLSPRQVADSEAAINAMVESAFELSAAARSVLYATLPLRDPLEVCANAAASGTGER